MRTLQLLLVTLFGASLLGACADAGDGASSDRPTVVVTTSILGDVVARLVDDGADVVTIMPPGVSPHDFQPSAQQVQRLREADALVVNGAGFEEGLLDVIESAEADGVPTHAAISTVEPLGGSGDDHADEDADDGGHDHGHDGVDPHFFTDPTRMATAVRGIADFLSEVVPALDAASLEASTRRYADELRALDREIEEILAVVPEPDRVLVTSHDVFGYFAERYGFEVVGTVIPGGSTGDGASAAALADLAETIEATGVPAIFTDSSTADDLAQVLAAEVGDVEVVELFSESLGEEGDEGSTYVDMLRVNAQRIADALT